MRWLLRWHEGLRLKTVMTKKDGREDLGAAVGWGWVCACLALFVGVVSESHLFFLFFSFLILYIRRKS